jgi:hypothetical protein
LFGGIVAILYERGVVMFSNILAEMARRQISKQEMSKLLKMSTWTFDRKLKNETGFTVGEIFEMQKIFNDENCTFEYLFEE